MEASVARRGTLARIDIAELEKLCAMQCTDEEIAAWFKVTTRTIERRRKVRKFAEIMDRGKARGKISVRRMQMKLLEEGNATMGVWLGKQLLGQTDHLYHDLNGPMIQIVVPAQPGRPQVAAPDDWDGVTLDIRPQGLLP